MAKPYSINVDSVRLALIATHPEISSNTKIWSEFGRQRAMNQMRRKLRV